MDKDLVLVYEFKNAPDEVKLLAESFKDSWLRLEKAKNQVDKWTTEFKLAQKAHAEASRLFKNAVAAWDPADKKTDPLKEIKEKEVNQGAE